MKGTFLLIYSTFALVLNTCSFFSPFLDDFTEPPLQSCTWGPIDVSFCCVELNIPSCVDLGWTMNSFYDVSEPFNFLVYSGMSNYGEFRWTSTSTGCDNETNTRITIFDTYNGTTHPLWNWDIPIDSAITVTGTSIYDVLGQASITINGLMNYSTGETISLIWTSPEYSGGTLFNSLVWIETAQVANVSNIGRVYIHNEYQ